MKGVEKKYRDKGLNVIGIGIQDDPEKFKEYAEGWELDWPVGFDNGDRIMKLHGITFGAGVIFIDPQGIVRGRFLGGFGGDDLEREVAKILPK